MTLPASILDEDQDFFDRFPKFRKTARNAARRLSRWSPRKNEALRRARIKRGVYECAQCGAHFCRDDVDVDHVIPAGEFKTMPEFLQFIVRLLLGPLQVLCRDKCHRQKTQTENKERKAEKDAAAASKSRARKKVARSGRCKHRGGARCAKGGGG